MKAYVGLGSNLGERESHIRLALEQMARLPETALGRVSSLYDTAPVGELDQPNFLNAVARALANGHHIEIRGFGTFRVKDRKSRIARNPRTGEAVPVPPRKVPVFKVSKELKDMVAQG